MNQSFYRRTGSSLASTAGGALSVCLYVVLFVLSASLVLVTCYNMLLALFVSWFHLWLVKQQRSYGDVPPAVRRLTALVGWLINALMFPFDVMFYVMRRRSDGPRGSSTRGWWPWSWRGAIPPSSSSTAACSCTTTGWRRSFCRSSQTNSIAWPMGPRSGPSLVTR